MTKVIRGLTNKQMFEKKISEIENRIREIFAAARKKSLPAPEVSALSRILREQKKGLRTLMQKEAASSER